MGIAKVEVIENGEKRTIIDLTGDSVTPETLPEGVTAHDASGEPIVGLLPIIYKDSMSLGMHTDGLLYLFVNGEPVGNGVALPSGASGDVVGNVDSGNNIVITGNLPDGTYTVKYEMEDGTLVDIGVLEFSATSEPEPVVNLIPTALDPNLTDIYNGVGYKEGVRYSGSSNADVSAVNTTQTGLIPLGADGDVFHIRGVETIKHVDGAYSGRYSMWDANGACLKAGAVLPTGSHENIDENGDFTIVMNHSLFEAVSGASYVRFQFGKVTGEVIVTRNQLIPLSGEPDTPTYTNFADPTSSDWKEGYRLTSDINQVTALSGGIATNYISVQTGDILEVTGINFTDDNNRQAYWFNDTNTSIVRASVLATSASFTDVSYDSNALKCTIIATCEENAQIRFSGLATGTSEDVTVKITRNGVLL